MCLKRCLSLALLLVLATGQFCTYAEFIDDSDVERFCFPEEHKNTRKSCECNNVNASPWGIRAVNIDCSFKELKTQDFSTQLPLYTDTLDLSWNSLDQVPVFVGDTLRLLNLMHNNISRVASKNFVQVQNLRELYLAWNSIQTLELNAFDGLKYLQVLDLSHNNLRVLNFQVFIPLLMLETLSLSWNRQLNESRGIQELDFYQTYGISGKLRTLKLEACGLSNVVLPVKANLSDLDLRRNQLTKVPEKLPTALRQLDLSGNLFEALLSVDTELIAQVKVLYLEDMPRLLAVEENAFVPLQSLQKVSFQNCRRLNSFHAYAFGSNGTRAPASLKSMSFRGSTLRTFNSTLSPVFLQLAELDLNGMPLYCDCELSWVRQLRIETNGRCYKPAALRGLRLSEASAADFSCHPWSPWLYGFVTLGLIILCSAGIYLIVMGLRPHRGVTMRRKVGAGSPYARVTIEPNRQENY